MKWRLLLASLACVGVMTGGLFVISLAAAVMNTTSVLLGLLIFVMGIGLAAIGGAWAFNKILFAGWDT